MARTVFLLLVLANLVFHVWAAGYLGGHDAGREPERLASQVQPERLRVTVMAEAPATAEAAADRP